MPNEPEVNIRAEDIVLSLRSNYYKRRRTRKKSKKYQQFDEQNIMIKRKDHICDFREKVNNKYQLYNKKANEFFCESNINILDQMNPISKKHLWNVLNFGKEFKRKFSTPRASNVRFSSFNKNYFSDFKVIHRDSDRDINIIEPSTNNSNKISHFDSYPVTSEKSTKKTHANSIVKKKHKADPAKIKPQIRSKSQPIHHSRDLIFEREMMGIFFKRMYGENLIFVIKKSKTFNLNNDSQKTIKKVKSRELIFTEGNDFVDSENITLNGETEMSQKLFDMGKSVKSIESVEKPRIFSIADKIDPLFEMRKQRNFSKRIYKCKVFTEKCQKMYKEYQEMAKEVEKKEMEKYKKLMLEMKSRNGKKKDKQEKKIGMFDMPFEKRIRFVYQMKRLRS